MAGHRETLIAGQSRIRIASRSVAHSSMQDWHLYIVRTRYGTLYTGIATDVKRRLEEHEKGGKSGARYLRSKAPFELVYRVKLGSRSLALRAEHRVKKLAKREKERFVAMRPGRRKLLALLGLKPRL